MDISSIDKFFEALSKDELKEKWEKYDSYSAETNNQVKVNDLINVWNDYYENIFVFHNPNLISNQNLVIIESESSFGLFFCILA